MFRLMKLLALGLFGYALYEFIRGMMQSEGVMGGGGSGRAMSGGGMGSGGMGSGGGGSSSSDYAEAGKQALSGPGEGERVTTSDFGGASVSHRVGRGVVRR